MSGTVQSYSLYTPQVFNFDKRISWLTQSNVLRKYKKNENTTLPESTCLYRYCKKCKTAKVVFLARKPYCCLCVHEGNNTICHICCYLRAHGLYAVSVVTLMHTVERKKERNLERDMRANSKPREELGLTLIVDGPHKASQSCGSRFQSKVLQ